MKLLLITSSLLLLTSCTQYRYNVTYEKCNGQTGSISYVGNYGSEPSIYGGRDTAVPYLRNGYDKKLVNNVCEFYFGIEEIK